MENCVCVMTTILRLNKFTITSLAIADEPGKRHATRAHRKEVVSDWLNPHSLGPCQPSDALRI